MIKALQDLVDRRIIPAVYNDPATVFGGEWTRKGRRMVCATHLLTDGHRSHDGNGTYIRETLDFIACDGGDPRINMTPVSYVMQARGIGFVDAVRHIATLYGIPIPAGIENETPETPEARQARLLREQQAAALLACKPATATAETGGGARIASYLQSRGLTPSMIADAGILYISNSPADAEGYANFRACESIVLTRVAEGSRPGGRGEVYKMAIPVRSGGRLAGICYAATPADLAKAEKTTGKRPPKYRLAKFDDAGTVVMNLRRASTQRYRWQARTVVAVEGYLDVISAEHAMKGNTPDVIGYLRRDITADIAQRIADAGYTSVVFCPDHEGVKQGKTLADGTRMQVSDVMNSAEALHAVGVDMYVVDLADYTDLSAKQDPNSMDAEAFAARVASAVSPSSFAVTAAVNRMHAQGMEQRDRDECKRIICSAIVAERDAITRRNLISTAAANPLYAGDHAAVIADADRMRAQVEAKDKAGAERAERMKKAGAYKRAAELIEQGNDRKASTEIQAATITDAEAAKLSAFTKVSFFDDIVKIAAKQPQGIELPFRATIGANPPFNLRLPPAGMTVISMPTSHGKTRLLENTLLHVLASTPADKSVIYVHYEESNAEVIAHLISIAAGVVVDGLNQFAGVLQLVATGRRPPGVSMEATSKVMDAAAQVRDYIDSGRLILVDNEPSAETICVAVMRMAERGELAAAFIDYIQKIKTSTQRFNQKKDLMEHCCDQINTLAKDAGIPIVVTSQLSRQAVSPWIMDVRHNADATNIEQTAYMNILGWNSSFNANAGTTPNTPDGLIKEIRKTGFDFGKRGYIAIKIAKNRTGQAGEVWGVLRFDPITGKMYQP